MQYMIVTYKYIWPRPAMASKLNKKREKRFILALTVRGAVQARKMSFFVSKRMIDITDTLYAEYNHQIHVHNTHTHQNTTRKYNDTNTQKC